MAKAVSKARLRGLLSDPNIAETVGLLGRMSGSGAQWAVSKGMEPAAALPTAAAGAPAASATGLLPRTPQAAAEVGRFMEGVKPVVEALPNIGEGAGTAPRRGLLGVKGAPTGRGLLSQAGNFTDDFLFGGAYGDRRAERAARDDGRAAAEAHRAAYAEAMGPNGFDPEAYGLGLAKRGQAPDLAGIAGMEGVTDSQDMRGARGRSEARGVVAGALSPYVDGRGGVAMPEPGDAAYLQDLIRSLGGPEAAAYEMPTTGGGLRSAVSTGLPAGGWMDAQSGWRGQDEVERGNRAGEAYRNDALSFQKDEAAKRLDFDERRFSADNAFRYDRAEAEDAYRAWELNNPDRAGIEGVVLRKALAQGVESLTAEELDVYHRVVALPQAGGFGFGAMGGAPPPGVAQAPQAAPAPAPRQAAPRGGMGTQQNPYRPQTEQEYQAVPPGSFFVDPDDGKPYRKGGR